MLPPSSGDIVALQNVSVHIQYCMVLKPKRVQCESDGLFITYYPIISLKTAGKYVSYLGGMIQTRIKPEAFPVQDNIYQVIGMFRIISNISSVGFDECHRLLYQFP
jgi:hypothetical protein